MSHTLISLHIRDFAIIAELHIDFAAGFTVLSGETGAGKSILFDALGLALGDRADSSVVRSGASRSEVSAEFSLARLPEVRRWLEQQGLLDEDEPDHLLLRRRIHTEGQNRAFINGAPSKLAQLRELAELLVDIHGQHAHQSLLKPTEQRRLLDAYGGHDSALTALHDTFQAWQEVMRQLARLEGGDTDTAQRQDLLRYQLQEFDELEPQPEDFARLEADFRRQSEADKLLQQAATASNLLYAGENSLYDQLQTGIQALQHAAGIDPGFEAALHCCEQAQISLKEAAQISDDLAADIDPDPTALRQISQRLDEYHAMARKHRVSPEELADKGAQLRQELQALESAETDREALGVQRDRLLQEYRERSEALTRLRQASAEKLGEAISRTVRPLGLPHAQCEVRVEHRPELAPQSHGQDQIEFLVAMNPGQAAAPLGKVASGGELARTSLAIQVVCLNQSPVPVLLFDEVDVGIGGGVAEVVGRRLQELSAGYQVFCVTHQPQVAALADTHFAVSKAIDAGQTYARIDKLPQDRRVEELARMLGGVKITAQTRSHAQEMLALGQAQPALDTP